MNLNVLRQILTEELGAEEADGEFKLPESAGKVTVMVESRDMMPVPKLRAVKVEDHYLRLTTEESRYFVVLEDVFAFKQEDTKDNKEHRPGFGI